MTGNLIWEAFILNESGKPCDCRVVFYWEGESCRLLAPTDPSAEQTLQKQNKIKRCVGFPCGLAWPGTAKEGCMISKPE